MLAAQFNSRKVSELPSAWTRRVAMKSIDEHIKKDQSDLEAAKAEGNDAKIRHISEELESLQDYKKEHPGDSHDPTPLELYCEANPDADECRVYDD